MYVSCDHTFRAANWPITEHAGERIRHECPHCYGYASVSMSRTPRCTVFEQVPLYWGSIDLTGDNVSQSETASHSSRSERGDENDE